MTLNKPGRSLSRPVVNQNEKHLNIQVNLDHKINIILTNKIYIANQFNQYFSSVGPNFDKVIPQNHPHFNSFLSDLNLENLTFNPTNVSEIQEILSSFSNPSKSSGYDEIPTFLLKKVTNMVSKPLSILINKSLASGIFPNKLKIAKIIPIFKSGDPSSFSNYRPVSILPAFSKVFEKVIYNRLLQHLNENSILYILSSSDSDKSIQPLTQLFNLLTKFLKQ